MAIDLQGMLTGGAGQQINPSLSVQQQQLALGANAANMMQGGMRSMQGQPPQGAQAAQLQKLMGDLDLNKTEDLGKLAEIMQMTGNTAEAGKIAAQLEARRIEKTKRSGLLAQATKLGLEETAEIIKSGGDLVVATKQVMEAEERDLISKRGLKGRIALAKQYGANDVVLKAIANGDYNDFSDTLFLEKIQGRKAKLQPYKRVEDGVETNFVYRVNEAGQVMDDDTNKWVDPADLGLMPSPIVQKTLSQANTVIARLTQGLTDEYLEVFRDAKAAVKIMASNEDSRKILREGVRTGFGTDWANKSLEIINETGLLPEKYMDGVAASRALAGSRGAAVLASIKIFGGGQGFTNEDRKFLERIMAADSSLTKESVTRLLDLEERVARASIELNNETLEGVMALAAGRGEDTTALTNAFYLAQPEKFDSSTILNSMQQPLSAGTLDILKGMGIDTSSLRVTP
jgi:hypothetical protein